MVVEVVACFLVKFNVAIESQPTALIKVWVAVVVAEYVVPFVHVYGKQEEIFVVLLLGNFLVKFKVKIESQPTALVSI